MTASQIETWGITYDPMMAELKSQEALAKGDKRLAHDILWDASCNGKGQNGWCIPDRGALNDAVNAWISRPDELSYASISQEIAKRGKKAPTLIGNPIIKATAAIEILGAKKGTSGYVFSQEVTTGRTKTTTLDKKLSMGISVAHLGIEASVSESALLQQQATATCNYCDQFCASCMLADVTSFLLDWWLDVQEHLHC